MKIKTLLGYSAATLMILGLAALGFHNVAGLWASIAFLWLALMTMIAFFVITVRDDIKAGKMKLFPWSKGKSIKTE